MTEANRNFPSRISFWPLCWRRLGRWTRRVPPCNRDFRLTPGFTIRRYREGAPSINPTYLARRERVFEGMRLPGCQRGNVRLGCAPCKGGAFQWVQAPPGNRSSRKQSEQSWR